MASSLGLEMLGLGYGIFWGFEFWVLDFGTLELGFES